MSHPWPGQAPREPSLAWSKQLSSRPLGSCQPPEAASRAQTTGPLGASILWVPRPHSGRDSPLRSRLWAAGNQPCDSFDCTILAQEARADICCSGWPSTHSPLSGKSPPPTPHCLTGNSPPVRCPGRGCQSGCPCPFLPRGGSAVQARSLALLP